MEPEKQKNNGTSAAEPSVHFKSGEPETVRMDSVSSVSPQPIVPTRNGCLDLPIMFEGAGSWWPNPRFKSQILEQEQWKTYFPQTRRRFQYALFYIFAACVAWSIFFGATKEFSHQWPFFLAGTLVLLFIIACFIAFTYTKLYKKLYLVTSTVVSILVCGGILLTHLHTESDLSTIGAFTATVEVLLMMYSVIPMPLVVTVLIGVAYSVLFEVLTVLQNQYMQAPVFLAGKVLLHICIHLMGIHLFTMRQVRQRSTFWKIGQSVIARTELELEKQIKEKMIHSLMPPSVAAEVMKARADKEEEGNEVMAKKRNSKTKALGKGEIIFRIFNMNKMDNVSILFADIVGFTKMSSNKTAEVLVGQLNDLFGRFDDLCNRSGCEKISTLGDCYYCVAGCPEPKPGHAKCCVEMGLGMIDAIIKFDEENNEQVNMRVGVHTGTVLCGIVGTRRFKFDVWSNDVTLANNMESTGQPGRVHISESSYEFLKDDYEVEEGEEVEDTRSEKKLVESYDKDTSQYAVKHALWEKKIKTYFILHRKDRPDDKEPSAGRSDTAVYNIDGEAGHPSESDTLMNDSATREKETSDANGVPTAKLVSSHLNSSLTKLDEQGRNSSPKPLLSYNSTPNFFSLTQSPPRKKICQTVSHNVTYTTPPSSAQASPTTKRATPIPNRATPTMDQATPTTNQATPTTNQATPTPNQATPTTDQATPTKEQAKPLTTCNPHTVAKTSEATPTSNQTRPNQNLPPKSPLASSVSRNAATPPPNEDGFDPTQERMDETWSKIRDINHHSDTDLHFVKCVREGIANEEYFYKPPINQLTLAFTDKNLEGNYRDHYMEDQHNQYTISAPKYHSFLEILVSFLVFIIISIFCFVVYDRQLPWLIFFIVSLLMQVLNIVCGLMTIKYSDNKEAGIWTKMIRITSGWYFRNVLGAVVVSIPILGVYTNFSCMLMNSGDWNDRFFCFCIMVCLLHYTNFTTLSSWMKSIIAFLAGGVLIVLIIIVKCIDLAQKEADMLSSLNSTQFIALNGSSSNFTVTTPGPNVTESGKEYIPLFSGIHVLQYEIILDMLLLIFLIGFLNRESEISYRLNFHGDAQAWEYKQIMQENKDQADWLLHNIIPPHVSEVVRKTSKYSKNHKDVGVIFAAIVNFNEIYDESFEGGREFLRVLNELVSDYEELLDDIRFKDVEKIKTINSTFMAASGLNEINRKQNKDKYAHLYALMEFSEELHNSIQRFNDSIFNFDFILNIGYNYGEVTAGVIGTTKLLYDIWGDTVNISSRMYSTGVAGKTQVPEATADLLGDKMDFKYRGEISVKGKGVMKTFLFVDKKPGATWN